MVWILTPISKTCLNAYPPIKPVKSTNSYRTIGNLAIGDCRTLTDQRIAANAKAIQQKELKIDQLTYELAYLRRLKFSHKSKQISALQMTLLDEVTDADIAAIESELESLKDKTDTAQPKKQPKRQPLPENLPRLEIRHDPESTTCSCGCQLRHIGEDVSEKLDYLPGSSQVERHIRSKWACDACETLVQKPMPPQIIDKGLPTSGLLAHLLIAKYADHLPLYRQAQIFERAGVKLPSSTLAEWVGVCGVQLEPVAQALKDFLLTQPVLHADETPVPMLKPGNKKTHKAYLWAYTNPANAQHKAVCSGQAFLDTWFLQFSYSIGVKSPFAV
ncbi:IS66 family transposase [Thiosulfatimonas sediminis]|uniref:IS66 family transposase n=1 Tax=Thiosulfatimonas sediminis TaxID=2675054 RepID=UPI003C7D931E